MCPNVLAALSLVALVGCGSDALSRSDDAMKKPTVALPRDVVVVLDIYSGRPNPSWKPTAAERAELGAMLEALETSAPREPAEGRLGYRGFALESAQDRGDAPRVDIYTGVVRHRAGQTITYWNDSGRQLEKWLLEKSRPHIGDGTYESVRAQLP